MNVMKRKSNPIGKRIIYIYNNVYVEIFGWCASTQKGDVQKSTLKNESTSMVRTFQTWTHGRPWFSQENVDNKMYCVVCISLA